MTLVENPAPTNRMPAGTRKTELDEPRIPLAALREPLMGDGAPPEWLTEVDGPGERGLVLRAGRPFRLRLTLEKSATFSSRVMLHPIEWRERHGWVRPWVAVADGHGHRHEIWSCTLRTLSESGHQPPILSTCVLPSSSQWLELGCDSLGVADSGPTSVVWLDPGLLPNEERPRLVEPPASDGRPAAETSGGPRISVLTPVHDPPVAMLEEAIDSVLVQSYPNWELCLADDGSRDPDVIATLERQAAADDRIHLIRHESARGIAAATNAALSLATGEYIALLDHDDTLTPDALAIVAARLQAEPELDMLYSDEDITDEAGRRLHLHLKPGWSPETICTSGYTCHLGVYRTSLAVELGGFRDELNGSQDYDFILRLIERTDRVGHIPRVLYHWRAHTRSTAGGGDIAKPYAYTAARQAIAEHLERTGVPARVDLAPPGLYRVVHQVDPNQTVAVLLLVGEEEPDEGLAAVVRSLAAQSHPRWQLVLVGEADGIERAIEAAGATGVAPDRIASQPYAGEPIGGINAAVTATVSTHLLLALSPHVGLTHDWLRRLIGYTEERGVGAAGPIVMDPRGRIEQAGVAMAGGLPLHLLQGRPGTSMDDLFGFGTAAFNVIAASGMIATRRSVFGEVGGLRADMGDLALIDYCLRAHRAGLRTVVVSDARVTRFTTAEVTNNLPLLWRFMNTWRGAIPSDPYYNPNYLQDRGDFAPAIEAK